MPYPPAEYPLPRPYECDGSHSSQTMKQEGPLEVLICADPCCAHVTAQCTCPTNEWDDTGQVLSCTFCGGDGT